MENGAYLPERASLQELEEVVLVNVVSDLQVGNVDELGAIAQIVNNNDVIVACRIECSDDITTDKAGSARDNNHRLSPAKNKFTSRPLCKVSIQMGRRIAGAHPGPIR